MAIPLKYNTASQEFTFGQALDSANGNDEEGGLTIANTDIKLHKAGTTTLASKNSGGATYISNGVWYGTFNAADTNTYGAMTMYIHVAGALSMKVEFIVMNAVAYDALYGTDNFDVNVTQWLGTAAATPTTAGVPEVDVTYWNATLGTNDDYPSKQSQIDSLAATPGVGASPSVPSTITVVAGAGATGDADDMANDDANIYTVNDNAGTLTLDLDYQLNPDTTVIEFVLVVAAQGNSDDIAFQLYDQVGSSFVTFETISGVNVLTYITLSKVVVAKYTDDTGLFQVRFTGTGLSSATLTINKAVAYSVSTVRSVGYALGRVWVDTVNGSAGTTDFVNGTADNKSDSLTSATTIAASVGLSSFDIAPGSSITLIATYSNAIAYIYGATLALGGQDISNTITYGGTISGITTGTGPVHFVDAEIQAVTFPPAHFDNCSLVSTFTIGSAGLFNFSKCYSEKSTGVPIIDFAAVGATAIRMSQYSGGIEFQNMAAGDTVEIQGDGEIIINANCAAGTLKYRGDFEFTDNSGSITITKDDNTANIITTLADTAAMQPKVDKIPLSDGTVSWNSTALASINAEADTALSDYDGPTNAEMEVRTPTAAQLLYITRHAATSKPVTFTGGTTTAAILGNVDGVAASSTDDVYNSHLLVFNAGTLDEQVCQITDYVGSTKTATITAVTTAVTSGHTAILV